MKANFLPVSLFVPVAEAPHVIHIVPPVCPMDQLLHGNPFHLHGQAKPVHAKAPLCGPLVRRACGGRLRAGKPAGGTPAPVSALIRPGCASNLQNGHAISRILTTPTYRIDLSIPKYHPGAHRAPQRNPISIFPSPSSPRTPHHPHPEPWRGTLERTRARQHLLHILARTLPFPTHSAAKQMAHAGAGFPPRRPVPGGRDGVWEQAGAPAHGHKKRALEHIQDP